MRRASSTPEMISTRHPVADFTHSRKAWELRASRSALVATTRTVSVTICCVVRWKRRRTLTVSAIDSGVRNPERKTPSPSRVTSRSSCRALSLPLCRRAIFRRTELEPISTAANVGMGRELEVHSLHGAGGIGSGVSAGVELIPNPTSGKRGDSEVRAVWLTRWAGDSGDHSLRLKNGSAQDDAKY